MKIDTARFGQIIIEEDKIIALPYGMLGFPDKKSFILTRHKENSPFFWLQSIDDPDLAFVVTNPYLFKPDYKIDLNDVIKKMLWDKEAEYELYVVVNIPRNSPEKMTANLIGPILINNSACQAIQIIMPDSSYPHKYPLIS